MKQQTQQIQIQFCHFDNMKQSQMSTEPMHAESTFAPADEEGG